VTVNVVDQGPFAAEANVPDEDDEENVNVRAVTGESARPAVCSCTVIGPAAIPEAVANGAVVNAGTVGNHVENDCHPVAKDAPSTVVVHQEGAQAGDPGSEAGALESLIAAARRARIASVWALKSTVLSPCVLLGAHAKPRRSTAAPVALPKERAA
jgi:hypothetical protein